MRRILFVDDEPRVLDGLQRMLRPYRDRWDMAFASSGQMALQQMEASPFDVVVTDMRMPGMDGQVLLTEVRDRYPGTVRMVLTGHTSLEGALRAVPVAHQFLVKPCDPNMLRVAVERACSLQALLGSELIRRTIGSMQSLPPMPKTYACLAQALADPDTSLDKISRIVEHDVSISAKILQLVNSPLFGVVQHISTLRTAVSYLGTEIIKNLVLSIEVFRTFEGKQDLGGYTYEQVHQHAFLTARIAHRLPTQGHLRDSASVAAVLHDVGKLILMNRLPAHFKRVVETCQSQRRPMHEVEQELIGITHAEIGAYLLGLWGLPFTIVEAVAYHHTPAQVPHQHFDSLATLHVADVLAHENEDPGGETPFPNPTFDEAYLVSLGVQNQVEHWRTLAAQAAVEEEGV